MGCGRVPEKMGFEPHDLSIARAEDHSMQQEAQPAG